MPKAVLFLLAALAFSSPARAAELWLYIQQNLWVDANVENIEKLFERSGKAGYTHAMIADSKSAKLGDMDPRYFRNVERVKKSAAANKLEIVPAVFPIGYSNDILWHDPNLVEAIPVRDVEMVVKNGVAELPSDSSLIGKWAWQDKPVTIENGVIHIQDPKGENARISQVVKLKPFHQYHLRVRVKTQDFKGTPEVKLLSGNRSLNHNYLGAKPAQDWTDHHVVFNSLDHTNANLYFGAWGAKSGEVWFDQARLEETMFVNLVRRPGAPLIVKDATGRLLKEGTDFEKLADEKMGKRMWPGSYDVWREPPKLKTKLPDGTKLSVTAYHAVTVHDDQAMICPSEPKTMELLRDQAKRVHAAWGAKGYFMSHDEIRVFNWCAACESRNMTAGQILAANVKECAAILRQTNPGGRIYVWSDMFDPNHNAHDDYYLARGTFAGSWEGLDKDVIVVPWYFEKRAESLRWFANRGQQQLIAGYYDHNPVQIRDWLKAAEGVKGILGVMYTTWQSKYTDLEAFAAAAKPAN